MSRSLVLAASCLCLISASARAQPAPATPDFVQRAASTDAFERRAGRLAERRAQNAEVKQFGAMMMTDHAMTTMGLKDALARAHLPPPATPVFSGEEAGMLDALRTQHGAEFDRTYIQGQVMIHKEALTLMQGYAQGGDNQILRGAAANTVAVVQHHLDRARQIEKDLGMVEPVAPTDKP